MIIQAVVAVFAGIVFFVKSNWNKIRGIKENTENSEVDSVKNKKEDNDISKAS